MVLIIAGNVSGTTVASARLWLTWKLLPPGVHNMARASNLPQPLSCYSAVWRGSVRGPTRNSTAILQPDVS